MAQSLEVMGNLRFPLTVLIMDVPIFSFFRIFERLTVMKIHGTVATKILHNNL